MNVGMQHEITRSYSPYRLVIFDVDGTLVDSFGSFIDVLNCFADKYRYAHLHKDHIEHLRELAPQQIRKVMNLSLWTTFRLMYDCKKEMHRAGHCPEVFKGMDLLLRQLKQQGIQLAIVTSNTRKNCQFYLGNDLYQLFDWVECNASIYGKRKQIKRILKHAGVNVDQAIYIGDQIIDIQSAQQNGIASAAVTWGFNNKKALFAQQPDYLIDEVEQLVGLLLQSADLN